MVFHRISESISVELMFNHPPASPPRMTTGQIGLFISVRIENLGDLRFNELAEVVIRGGDAGE